MIVAPAVDVRQGRCVQLVGGDPGHEAIALDDPVAAAQRWRECGFGTLHLVDLDAALAAGQNSQAIEQILTDVPGDAQVGGGIRTEADIDRWLSVGAARVIVGTSAVDDPEWAVRQAEARPGQLIVAADVKENRVLRRGWTDSSQWSVLDFLDVLSSAPLAGVLITDVGREGRLSGIDAPWIESVVAAHQTLPLLMSGGVTSAKDVRDLAKMGVDGVVIGMALYTGRIDPTELEEFMGGMQS